MMRPHTTGQRIAQWLTAVVLALSVGQVAAQLEDMQSEFRSLDAAGEQKMRALLDEPMSAAMSRSELEQRYWDRDTALRSLGELTKREANFREAIAASPDPGFKRNLAQLLMRRGDFDEGNALMRQVLQESGPVERAFTAASMVCDYYEQNRDAEARNMAREADRRIGMATSRAKEPGQQIKLVRAAARRDICLSLLEGRVGHFAQSIEFAKSGEQFARTAMPLYDRVSNSAMQAGILADVAVALDRKFTAYLHADRLQDAENTLKEYAALAREVQLAPQFLATMYASAARLRFAQREFGQSEQFLRKSDAVLAGFGLKPVHRQRLAFKPDLLSALIGQKKWGNALQELDELDRLNQGSSSLKTNILYPVERGIVYLQGGRTLEAAALFEGAANQSRAQNGDSHFFTAQNSGLQGAALWRSGVAEHQARALALLKAAVRDYMAPSNADFSEAVGIRREIREIVFAAYLDAAASTSPDEAIRAMGPADWARSGVVKDALNDAAARSAAGTPALADVVRREQDAKNEIAGLRRYLAGELGGSQSPLPQVAAQMRERIAVLEGERSQLQAELKAKFPDYDRLIRPTTPTAQDIARQLNSDQALVLLLPGADGVYVWAVARDRAPGFVRARLAPARVRELVSGLRRQLDFGAGNSVGTRFDGAAAFALYDALLAPLAAVLQDKTQLIIGAGGALSQLPFGLLHTQAGGGFDENAPWLIRKASVTQVPSLSAWSAIRALSKALPASQAFAGWGDPAFDLQLADTRTTPAKGEKRSVLLSRSAALAAPADLEKATAAVSAIQYAKIPALPDTRDELLAIAATLHSDASSDLLLGAQATRASVLQASRDGRLLNKRVIAFATHGLMAGDLPGLNQPALALAATGTEAQEPLAPLLTLEDVLTLKLNADWVVLSACNTAAEDGRGDEAMSGLARGFFYAGSRSLLVTHWAVETESAKMLTTATFAHYAANPKAPKAESLRQAMLQVMALPQFRHPAFWAPYALVGDGGR